MERQLRAEIDITNEKISYKIRKHSNNKIPIIIIVGKKEMEQKTVTVRRLGTNNQDSDSVEKILDQIENESYMP